MFQIFFSFPQKFKRYSPLFEIILSDRNKKKIILRWKLKKNERVTKRLER